MKYIVAVSGGVDSVVLLDMLVHKKVNLKDQDMLIVAHFDHGIRPDSAADARFVHALAASYGLAFESKREELGVQASEALARERRYAFLGEMARKYDAQIVTAHHLDDLVETIAINLTRGTGWRGLAVLGSPKVQRPLLAYTKNMLYEYATSHRLEWVEDETNQQDGYLRNQLRRQIQQRIDDSTKYKLAELRHKQLRVAKEINDEVQRLIADEGTAESRYFFTMINEAVALELLRTLTKSQLTRPRLSALLLGIKTSKAGAKLELGEGLTAYFTQREFIVKPEA